MNFYTNPAKDDEICERTDIADPLHTDPINPKLGYYYLFNEVENKIHTHFNGEQRFQSLDSARFARSCSTMWPFLKIYRHWELFKRKATRNSRQRKGACYMWTEFENIVIKIYNKAASSENAKVEYKQSTRRDDLDNLYIDVEYSGILRNVQEQICEIYDRIDKEKVLRATELLIRSFSYRNGPALTLPDEFEKCKLIEEINSGYKRKPIKIIPKIKFL